MIDLAHQLLADFNGFRGNLDGGCVSGDVGAWYWTF